MKGVYSSPDSVNARVTQAALHPDSTYAKDSGGDPEAIPTLTFDGFKVRWGLVVVVVFVCLGGWERGIEGGKIDGAKGSCCLGKEQSWMQR